MKQLVLAMCILGFSLDAYAQGDWGPAPIPPPDWPVPVPPCDGCMPPPRVNIADEGGLERYRGSVKTEAVMQSTLCVVPVDVSHPCTPSYFSRK